MKNTDRLLSYTKNKIKDYYYQESATIPYTLYHRIRSSR
jgi:hypothetical protein